MISLEPAFSNHAAVVYEKHKGSRGAHGALPVCQEEEEVYQKSKMLAEDGEGS